MLTPRHLHDDLRPAFRGPLHVDDLSRGLYSTDASPFQITPLAVAVPADADDLRTLVKYCHEHGVPLTARGAGTGLAGESLGPGVVVDLSVNFRRVVEIGADLVRVEPGVTHAELNAALAKAGRRFAPDPASGASCTVGGMVATNASGGTAFRHGYTRDYVQALRVVWDTGETDDLASREQVGDLLTANRDLIHLTRPHTAFNRCGYVLHDVMTPAGPDLARLLVGSEGTLALVTEATLRTVPLPGGVGVFALGFATLDDALRAGLDLRGCEGVAGCDLLDQRLLALGRPDGPVPVPAGVGAALVVTVEADTERDAARLGRAAVEQLRAGHRVGVMADPTADPDGVRRVRAFRDAAVSGLYALGRGRRPEAFIEDVAVPAEDVPAFVAGVQELLRADGLTASFLIHALTGQVHTRPLVDLADPADRAKLWPLAEKVHALALSLNGTVSTQHGVGVARTPWVEKQYGPLMSVFRELKRIFDPKSLLNPGKILGPDPSRPAWPLRVAGWWDGEVAKSVAATIPPPKPLLLWKDGPQAEAAKCNGCGDCRPRGTAARMCPVFRATGTEAATPRAKANLLKLLADPKDLTSEEVRAVAGLCVNCKMCRDECRAGVDVPKLMLEAKAAHAAEHDLDRPDWFFARVESLAALTGNFAFTANLLLGRRPVRWLVEKWFGLSRRRTLPRFAGRTFLSRAWRAGLTRRPAGGGRKVAYFVDTFANHFDPLTAVAAVAVLRHHGIEVHVPWKQRGSGMPALAVGDADAARDIAAYNVRTLAGLVRDGYTVVCSEPTAAVALTQDYLSLLDDPDTELVARNTVELTAFLWRLHEAGELKPPTRAVPVGVGHHVPCHVKALRGPVAGPRLLGLIPGLTVHTIDVGCSGMAGVWGLSAANHGPSLTVGSAMLNELDRPRSAFGSTECSACRMQMQEGTGKRTLHPVQYLALAYGLLPQVEQKMAKPVQALVSE